jgi:RNA polymerase sigma factor (sigma-70 family)
METQYEFESLSTYILLAKKTISKFAGKFYESLRKEMLSNEDAVSDVATAIMQADWKWDANRTGKTGQHKSRYAYRNQCAIWAIQTYISKKYNSTKSKTKHYSLDFNDDNITDKSYYSNISNDSAEDPLDILIRNEKDELISDCINKLLSNDMLTEKQREQMHMYYFDNLTLNEIGQKYGVTREAIRQNIKKAITLIKAV